MISGPRWHIRLIVGFGCVALVAYFLHKAGVFK